MADATDADKVSAPVAAMSAAALFRYFPLSLNFYPPSLAWAEPNVPRSAMARGTGQKPSTAQFGRLSVTYSGAAAAEC
jgi:hypothetical protein